ncbi:DNA polymerase eta isoform X2 [Ipomoea triloba]|uniref:DNA polymerase eta isoform X2 n=1 Tax=Ipomoea triloba TaxID=35885 RepID=UPI00125E0497|nr:DNA polymerase eta isoform X2 [Ipomoea triloba]
MPVARPESSDSRVIAHVDMDCFYVQVEQRKQPSLRGQPTAVVQYNSWQGGALIAVSYEARKFGVKRSMRGDEAKQVCPEIQLVQVPVARGKADLNTYRNAGSEVKKTFKHLSVFKLVVCCECVFMAFSQVVSILARKGICERASIDEVYLDLTEAAEKMLKETPPEKLETINEEAAKSHVLGIDKDENESVKKWLCRNDADYRDKLLACGALIVAELRLQVLNETEFTCSAGIAHNKMLAKLTSGMNKPAQQTVVPSSFVMKFLEPLPIKKMKQLGGKLGTSLQIDLGVNTVGDLLQFSEEKLQELFGINTGTWLWNTARGMNGEEVQGRLLPKSHGSGKTFPGPRALRTIASVEKWLRELCDELNERLQSDLEQNKRIAKTLTLHASAYKTNDTDSFKKFPSKSCPLRYGTAKIQEDALILFQAGLREFLGYYNVKTPTKQQDGWGVTGLSISASKIVSIPSGTRSIMNYFQNQDQTCSSVKQLSQRSIQDAMPLPPLGSGNHSTLHSSEPKVDCIHESKGSEYAIPTLEIQEEDGEPCTVQGLLSTSCHQEDGFSEETVALSFSGAETCSRLEPNQVDPMVDPAEETTNSLLSKEQKRKPSKNKGTSILGYFQSQDSFSKVTHGSPCQESEASSPGTSMDPTGQNDQRRHARSYYYNINEIDPAVVNELPQEIQDEVRAWLRPRKQANTTKKGSDITSYFSRAKDA